MRVQWFGLKISSLFVLYWFWSPPSLLTSRYWGLFPRR